MGVVFKAFDTKLERTVALKFLNQSPADANECGRVLREARAASILDHKNIAAIYSVEEGDDGELFIVMAFHDGESLDARMREGPFSIAKTVQTIRDVAQGLRHAHDHNVVHRDIKPSNIILTNDGTAVIIDFGLARFVNSNTLTQSASFAGSLLYMSPEQLAGKPVDARSDIWSLGVIAYQLLTGCLPFPGDNPAIAVRGILHEEPDFTKVPAELRQLVEKALSKNLARRYQNCAELLNDLEAIETPADSTIAAVIPVESEHRARGDPILTKLWRRWGAFRQARVRLLFGALLLVALGVLAWKQWPTGKQDETKLAAYESYLRGAEYLRRYDKPGNLEGAIKSFETSTEADPKFALAFAALGEAYWIKYRLNEDPQWVDSAITAGKRAAQLNDQLPAVYITLGRIHGGTSQHDLAIEEFQRAFKLDRSNADALLGLADVYAEVGRNQEAEDNYKRAIAMRPGNWLGPYRLGSFYFGESRFADAVDQFRRVLQLVPDSGLAHAGLGVSALSLGNDAEAEFELKRAINIAPDYAAYTNLGLLYYTHRRFSDAAKMMERALSLNDRDFRQWDNLADTYEWLGQKDKVAQAHSRERLVLEECLRIRPEDPAVQANLAALYAYQHIREKALAHLETALALAPNDPRILSKAGETYEDLGERQKAIEYLGKAMMQGYTIREMQLTPDLRALLADPEASRALHVVTTTR
jgi:eukaryotic-like serine/threonine-protein kinase